MEWGSLVLIIMLTQALSKCPTDNKNCEINTDDKVMTGIIRKNTVKGPYELSDKSRMIISRLIVQKGVKKDNQLFWFY
jgi:hypothetical protein